MTSEAAVLQFRVYGIAAPAGSKTAIPLRNGKTVIVDGGSNAARDKRRVWRQDVVEACRRAMADQHWEPIPADRPVMLRVTFIVPRPRSAPKRVVWPVKRPDATKLLRAIEDAITTAGAWADDAQVVHLVVGKRFAADGEPTGAMVTVEVPA